MLGLLRIMKFGASAIGTNSSWLEIFAASPKADPDLNVTFQSPCSLYISVPYS
jgi:hypothetical protein